MLKALPSLQLILVHAPYDTLADDRTPPLLTDLLKLKLQGYQRVYEPGVLPIDTYDFISTHLLVGFQHRSRFDLIMAFRSTTLERCRFHRLKFPGLAVLENSGANEHAERLQLLLNRWSEQDKIVSYTSAWTIASSVRPDRELRDCLRDLTVGFHIHREWELGSHERVLCGAPKLKTDQLFQTYSYKRVEKNSGGELPVFKQASLMGEEAVLLHSDQFNDAALRMAERVEPYWRRRIVIGTDQISQSASIKKAA